MVGQRLSEPVIDYSKLKSDFKAWLFNRIDKKTAQCYINYLDRYMNGVVIADIDDLIEVCLTVNSGWNWYAKAVRNLINYCIERRLIDKGWAAELKEVLKLKRVGVDTFVPSDEAVKAALEQCKDDRVKMLLRLLLYSGIRITEAIKVLSEFDESRLHFDDGVAWYDIDWSRGNKNAYKAFMPSEFAKQLKRIDITENIVHKNKPNNLKLKHCRNWTINKLVQCGVNEGVIQYMVGHSNGSTLFTNYLEKLHNSIHAYKHALPHLQSILH